MNTLSLRPELSTNQDEFKTAMAYSDKDLTVTNMNNNTKGITLDDGYYTAMEPSQFNDSRRPTDIFDNNKITEEGTKTDNIHLSDFRESEPTNNKESVGTRHTVQGGDIKMDLDGLMVEEGNKKKQVALE